MEGRAVEGLIARGVNALIILAWDKDAVLPAVNKAKAEKIPVIGYDRLIETPGVFYITFENREVGRMQAREVFKVRPQGALRRSPPSVWPARCRCLARTATSSR